MLPAALYSALAAAPAVGFSGSRSVVPPCLPVVVSALPAGVPVLVGCAAGVDAAVRGLCPSASVFRVVGSGRGAFAARSVVFVRAVAAAGGVLVSFPAGACPVGLLPSVSASRAFCGTGSGSWASLSLAVGLGVPCVVFSAAGVPSGWGFVAVGDGWFSFVPAIAQLGLF
jgi:hypothetical protein